ncbi:hypothetical protein BC829DRAFT_414244 [Chytridium lagenaria]|nr:hypothetical protein BC829DRAFT_414244 [Chytridium lagenaria]
MGGGFALHGVNRGGGNGGAVSKRGIGRGGARGGGFPPGHSYTSGNMHKQEGEEEDSGGSTGGGTPKMSGAEKKRPGGVHPNATPSKKRAVGSGSKPMRGGKSGGEKWDVKVASWWTDALTKAIQDLPVHSGMEGIDIEDDDEHEAALEDSEGRKKERVVNRKQKKKQAADDRRNYVITAHLRRLDLEISAFSNWSAPTPDVERVWTHLAESYTDSIQSYQPRLSFVVSVPPAWRRYGVG